ncbi:hypothetical protein MTR67_022683 [Solanum verrucosum]|uniref:Uncharacterized protein n=1 Tax=Solanum verrucosum TaxID=315347 RepID=A0AAF0QVS4_SOLVR|nr:hypothetical protein MTR67_022683 [Solanum verrucosum]
MQILKSCRCNLRSLSTDRRLDHGPWFTTATPPQTSSEKSSKSRLTDKTHDL